MLREHFQKIICLDNAMDCINEYKRKFGGRVDFSIFTSSIADYITCLLYTSTLADLSRIAGMTPKYFCRYFRAAIHRTPMDYLNYYRIERACYIQMCIRDSCHCVPFRTEPLQVPVIKWKEFLLT